MRLRVFRWNENAAARNTKTQRIYEICGLKAKGLVMTQKRRFATVNATLITGDYTMATKLHEMALY